MKVTQLTWQVDSNGVATLRCPVCNTAWATDDQGDISTGQCQHLRFIWAEGEPAYYGEWDTRAFERRYIEAYRKKEELEEPEDALMGDPDSEVLSTLISPEIDQALFITETGMACGPASFTACYGIKYD